jgi:hypothetical protein
MMHSHPRHLLHLELSLLPLVPDKGIMMTMEMMEM